MVRFHPDPQKIFLLSKTMSAEHPRVPITVFCSAETPSDSIVQATRELGTLLGDNGCSLVWGASNKGLMEIIASSVQKAGGELFGVTTTLFAHQARPNIDKLISTDTLGERIQQMRDMGEAIVLLPGGIGSLQEISQLLNEKKAGLHNKPVAVLNTDGFWNPLKEQIERIERDGFLPRGMKVEDLVVFVDTPQEVIDYLDTQLRH